MASSPPLPYPGPDVSIAGRLIATIVPLGIISIALFILRIRARVVPVLVLWWDDWTITAAILIAVFQLSVTLSAIPYGLGRHDYYISMENQVKAGRLIFIAQPAWSWAVALPKISIAFMLLRFKHNLQWRVILYAMILIQVASAISANVVQFSVCRPLAAFWDSKLLPTAQCWPLNVAQNCIIANAIVAIVTDVIFTFLPLSFIRNINRPFREKAVLSFLMGLGLLTSVASIVKTTKVKSYGKSGDTMYGAVDLSLWSIVEQQIGIIAACIPCLKAPGERFLRRIGMLSTKGTAIPGSPESYGDGTNEPSCSGLRSRATRENKDVMRLSDLEPTSSEQDILSTQREHSVVTDVEAPKMTEHFDEEYDERIGDAHACNTDAESDVIQAPPPAKFR